MFELPRNGPDLRLGSGPYTVAQSEGRAEGEVRGAKRGQGRSRSRPYLAPHQATLARQTLIKKNFQRTQMIKQLYNHNASGSRGFGDSANGESRKNAKADVSA